MGTLDFEKALKNADNDQDLLKEVIGIFIEDTPEVINNLQEYINTENKDKIVYVAHSLKGMAGNICANDFWNTCARLEEKAPYISKPELIDMFSEITQQHKLVMDEAKSILD